MPESTATRPAWVDELVTRFGEPALDCSEPFKLGDRTRQCWAWLAPRGMQLNLIIDDLGDGYHVQAKAFGRWVDMQIGGPPTDDEMRALCALAWPEAATA